MSAQEEVQIPNKELVKLDVDHLYHFGLSSAMPLQQLFGDVRFVVIGGSSTRMEGFAAETAAFLGLESSKNLSTTDRYALFKVGPVLTASHGIGGPSCSIMLHEIAKLLHYSKAQSPQLIRMGTSGGLGLTPGTVVIADKALNAELKCEHHLTILGNPVSRPAEFSPALAAALQAAAPPDVTAVIGHTLSCDDFYEGQGRLDGALCSYTPEAKLAYLERAHKAGVRNIEMEGLVVASFCQALGIPAAMLCVTLLDRLLGDQIPPEHPDTTGPQRVVLAHIRNQISAANPSPAAPAAANSE
eukprot:m.68974 g.68974  ORF g.68974 m.68974 type:complete len:300 (+) comp12805_c0_seq3:250-1149(+)